MYQAEEREKNMKWEKKKIKKIKVNDGCWVEGFIVVTHFA